MGQESDTDVLEDETGDDTDADADSDGSSDAETQDKTYDAAYVRKLREENARRRRENQELAGRVKSYEDADKTELERAEEARQTAEQRVAAAETAALQLEVALDKAPEGMPVAQVGKLAKRLTGATREEIEADADELFADFTPERGQEPASGRPRERLRPGAAPSSTQDEEETDPAKLAARVRARSM